VTGPRTDVFLSDSQEGASVSENLIDRLNCEVLQNGFVFRQLVRFLSAEVSSKRLMQHQTALLVSCEVPIDFSYVLFLRCMGSSWNLTECDRSAIINFSYL
jgi:hypothetical protein